MAKLFLFSLLCAAACLIAGAFGALHNQISYTVSPDYFHSFKFEQFDIPAHLHGRVGAAIVGWGASWWMGLLIGPLVLLVGLIIPGWRAYLVKGLVAFGVVAATALLVGVGALVFASFTITDVSQVPWWVPEDVGDPVAFARAGTMHNLSYVGGGIGIVTAWIYLAIERIRFDRKTRRDRMEDHLRQVGRSGPL